MQIYLDYSATTPPCPEAIASLQIACTQLWGNPSSLHAWGKNAATVLETARMQVAQLINAPHPESIVFTSSGTEADNLAMMGVANLYSQPQHVIISSVEHPAVSEPARLLEMRGWEVTRLPVDSKGRVNPQDLREAIRQNTVLISIIYGQSEVGTLQPIPELAKIAQQHQILFHTDAVQVAGRLPICVQELSVDLLSISSHKIYGCQGAGALYVRPGVEIMPVLAGGGQENRLRSGTQAVPVIAAFGTAAQLAASELPEETARLTQLRDRLFTLLADTPELVPTGDLEHRLPHHVSFCWQHSDHQHRNGRSLVRHLDMAGIAISAGSACSSGKLKPSPILLAMGYSETAALGGIRLTLGKSTTMADIEWTAIALKQVLARLR